MSDKVTAPTRTHRGYWKFEAYSRGYATALANHAEFYPDRAMPKHKEYVDAHKAVERIDKFYSPLYEAALTSQARDNVWIVWQSALRPHEFKVMA